METTLRVLISLGIGLLLMLLRFDAGRFGAADYDEPGPDRPPLLVRLAWYVVGIGLVAAVVLVHPAADAELSIGLGSVERATTVLGGLGLGVAGAAAVVAIGRLLRGGIRFPSATAYPLGILNAVGTALIDEAAFRGVVLGFLLLVGVDPLLANLAQACVYGLATRLGAPGRDPLALGVALGIGFVGGWLTIATGGIGAAFFGHAIVRSAYFVCLGHPGWSEPRARREDEDAAFAGLSPDGWEVAGEPAGEPEGDWSEGAPGGEPAQEPGELAAAEVIASGESIAAGELIAAAEAIAAAEERDAAGPDSVQVDPPVPTAIPDLAVLPGADSAAS